MTMHARRIAVVAVLAVAVLVAGWYLALWSPQNHNLSKAHTAHTKAEQQIGQLNTQVSQYTALLSQIPSDQARLAAAQGAVPDNPSLDTALRLIHHTALATGVNVTSVGPSVPPGSAQQNGTATTASGQASSGVPTVTLTISAGGTEQQVLDFVAQLTNLSQTHRVFVVDHIAFSGSPQVSASMSVRIFYAGQPTP